MSNEVSPNSPAATELQDAIQAELISRGWSTEGDEVMAEFIFVMVCNKKSPELITNELQELVASDFSADFISWLFAAVARVFPNSQAAKQYGPAQEQPQSERGDAMVEDDRRDNRRERNGRDARGSSNVFGNAVAGMKRPSDSQGPPSQRQRTDRDFNRDRDGPYARKDNDRNTGPMRNRRDDRSLFDRMGPQPINGGLPVMSPMGPAIYNPANGQLVPMPMGMDMDAGDNSRRNGRRGGRGNNQPFQQPQGMPFMFNMHGQQQGPPGFFPQNAMPNGFAPNFGPNPAFAQQNGQEQKEVPTKPMDEGLCKYATECQNAYCRYAHPSPAATKESGLVLSAEICDKQLDCEDGDCPKSHVSPQAKDPSASRPPPKQDTAGIPRSNAGPSRPFPAQPPIQYGPPGGTGPKPCKFGANCSRPDCIFVHPWDITPCRFGMACTRADCHFSHPPGHNPYRAGGQSGRGGFANKGNKTAIFNTPAGPTDKLKNIEAEKKALTERMQKFSNPELGGERIVPGGTAAETNGSAMETDPIKMES